MVSAAPYEVPRSPLESARFHEKSSVTFLPAPSFPQPKGRTKESRDK